MGNSDYCKKMKTLFIIEIERETEMTTMEEFAGTWMQTSATLYDEFLKVRLKSVYMTF